MKTRRFCPKCGRPVLKSQNDKEYNGYSFQCYACDEDFFKFEVWRKKDMRHVKLLQHKTISREITNGEHYHSAHKAYPRLNN